MATLSQVETNYRSRLKKAEENYAASMAQYDALTAYVTKSNRCEIYEKADAIYDAAVIELRNAKANALALYQIEMQNL